jgi:hypothetical protein
MTPREFIERLSRHYSKRHESDHAQTLWLQDMMGVIQGAEPKVLDQAFQLVRDEYDERAFPLPATLRKFIARAADIVHPESKAANNYRSYGPSKRAPDTREEIERCRLANEWQHEMMKQYGTWAAYYRAHKHLQQPASGIKPVRPERETEPAPIANRDYFANKPKWKAGTLAEEITRRITGERE